MNSLNCSELKHDLPTSKPRTSKGRKSVTSFAACLSDKAGEVREETKRIGRARVKWDNPRSVMIITKPGDTSLIAMTRELALWLILTPRGGQPSTLSVYVDEKLRASTRFKYRKIGRFYPETRDRLLFWNPELIASDPRRFDFVITLGGDGTVLFTSWLFQNFVPPVIPFHLGSLGFLTPFNFDHYDRYLANAMDNGVRLNLRGRLCCTVYRRVPDPDQHHVSQGDDARVKLRNIKRNTITGKITVGGWCKKAGKKKVNKFGELDGMLIDEHGHARCQKDGDHDHHHADDHDTTHDAEDGLSTTDDDEEDYEDEEESDDGLEVRRRVPCFTTVPVQRYHVINDLVVDRGPSPYVSQLELFGDDRHLTTVQADGLAISTPTGSTAYSLSAGGSLTHPEIHAILITPICPHTLSFRPTLVPDSMELRICVPYNSRSTAWASFDGRGRVELRQGDHIKVTASKHPFPTVCKEDQASDWFNSLQNCLHWNKRQRQKSFAVVESNPKSSRSPSSQRHASNSSSSSSGGPATPAAANAPTLTPLQQQQQGQLPPPQLSTTPKGGSTTSLRNMMMAARRTPYSPSTSSASSENGHDEIFGIFSDDDPYARTSPDDDPFDEFGDDDDSDQDDLDSDVDDLTSFYASPVDGNAQRRASAPDALTDPPRRRQGSRNFEGWDDDEIVRGRLNAEIRRAGSK
ncbi:ATP-NAD kinase-like domain-containing protein [Gongronella butleri]|nr:ATP-NAD kinase-like domain-containing protein [Gongronella butleri]